MPHSNAERSAGGFTLLEVMVATFVLAVVLTGVIQIVTQTIASLSRARLDVEAADFAQEQMRGVALAAKQGTLPEVGTSEGSFEGDDDLRFELKVEAYDVPVNAKDRELARRSSVFGATEASDPSAGPDVRVVTLRVYRRSEGIEDSLPLTMLVTRPAEVPETGPGATPPGVDDGTNIEPDGSPQQPGRGGRSRRPQTPPPLQPGVNPGAVE